MMDADQMNAVLDDHTALIANAVDTETKEAHNRILATYGFDYWCGWKAGRIQAAEEIRSL